MPDFARARDELALFAPDARDGRAVEPVIRDATLDDIPFLIEVVMLSSRSHVEKGVWDLAIPDDEAKRRRCVEAVLTTEQCSWCHYKNFVVAEVDGVPAAGLSAFAAYDTSLLPMEKAIVAGFDGAGLTEDEIGAAFRRILVFATCHIPDVERAWIVEWVATLVEYRGQGLVRDLLQHILKRGHASGHPLSQIGILTGNTPAQRAYESVGFVVAEQKSSDLFEAVVGSPGLTVLLREYG